MTTKTKQDKILVPIKRVVEAKEFYDNQLHQALRNCLKKGLEPLFMPQVIDTRIEADKDSRIWNTWYSTPSIKATGKTKQGNIVIVYAHIPNHFSNPDNIKKAIEQGLIKGAGKLPREEFQRLLDREDNQNVFVVDYNELRNSQSSRIKVKDALKHPQTIPFLGGGERAEKYLKRHEEVYGDQIGIWHSDDLSDEPLARLLFVGDYCDGGLVGYSDLDDSGRFSGVDFSGEATQKISLDENKLTNIIKEYVAPINREELEERIKSLFE